MKSAVIAALKSLAGQVEEGARAICYFIQHY
jgi:hypothetical protein